MLCYLNVQSSFRKPNNCDVVHKCGENRGIDEVNDEGLANNIDMVLPAPGS